MRERAREILPDLNLESIVTPALSAERTLDTDPITLALETEGANNIGDTHLRYKFDSIARALDAEGDEVALIRVTMIVSYGIPPRIKLEPSLVQFLGNTVAWMAAYPFMRELIHDLGRRLGIENMLLGVLQNPAASP